MTTHPYYMTDADVTNVHGLALDVIANANLASLPSATANYGAVAWAKNVCVNGQASGHGTGAFVMASGGNWLLFGGTLPTT